MLSFLLLACARPSPAPTTTPEPVVMAAPASPTLTDLRFPGDPVLASAAQDTLALLLQI